MNAVTRALRGLDTWFDAMRVDWPTPGYGGVVVHWWNHCLAYRGAGLDWRYEGIVDGYLTLWRRSGDRHWLAKAMRAGDDLVAGLTIDGHFANSQFERNPGCGGTPHEAACDVALLLLAKELRRIGDPVATRYWDAARHNLEAYSFGRLWNGETSTLWDRPGIDSFVPNKAATFVEAVLLLAELSGDETLISRYAIPTGDRIIAMQCRRSGYLLDGAIAQNRFGSRVVESYFPLYIARCLPALILLDPHANDRRFLDAANAAAAFLVRVRLADGSLPQVLYGSGRRNVYPRWIAGSGDIVRALEVVRNRGAEVAPEPTLDWLLKGVRSDGRIATADGFGRIIPVLSRRDRFADEVGVVGWCDKAFRVLAALADPRDLNDGDVIAAPSCAKSRRVVR